MRYIGIDRANRGGQARTRDPSRQVKHRTLAYATTDTQAPPAQVAAERDRFRC